MYGAKNWLKNVKDFRPMPDRLGYFSWHGNLNLYIAGKKY